MSETRNVSKGGCACGHVRYEVESNPLITHCCHCRFCQRQTGSAFALNALFDTNKVQVLSGSLEIIETPSPSGRGQTITRCPNCKVAIWSNYYMGGIKELIRFIRVGTLDNPDQFSPDVHIFTNTKQPWVNLPPDALVFEKFYDFDKTWTNDNNKIRLSLLAKTTNG